MGSWREARVQKELPVRVRGTDYEGHPFVQNTCTVDISRRGARLDWVSSLGGAGETVEVQHGRQKACYRVVWMGQVGTAEDNQIGVCSLEPSKDIWGIHLPPPTRVEEPQTTAAQRESAPAPRRERRRRPRYRCLGGVQLWQDGAQVAQGGTLSEISTGGCYIESKWPLPTGTRIEVLLRANEFEVRARGVVGYWHPSLGMGITFTDISTEDRQRLEKLTSLLGSVSRPS